MFFTLLTFAAALFIEGLGSLVSVIGISALFGANPIIIALAISLDVGKIVTVSLLYTYWQELSKLMKAYALMAATVTMIITSAGAAGYLSGAFQTAIIGTKEGEIKVSVLKEQQAKYQERKKQIDDQIFNLPARTSVGQRLRLINGFKDEQKALDDKITAIDKELPDAQIKQISVEAKTGPILYVAKAFDIPVEQAVKYVIGLIIFVFDPLAIFLIVAGNFLWARQKKLKTIPEAVLEEQFSLPEKTDAPAPFSWDTIVEPVIDSSPLSKDELVEKELALEPIEAELPATQVELPSETDLPIAQVELPTEEIPESVEAFEETVSVVEVPNEEPKSTEATFIPTGLLKPVNVDLDVRVSSDNMLSIKPLSLGNGPKPIPLGKKIPEREQITRSSLGLIDPDPSTVVDAGRLAGFTAARAISPVKK